MEGFLPEWLPQSGTQCRNVSLDSVEGMALSNYFLRSMPTDTKVLSIYGIQNDVTMSLYNVHRQRVEKDFLLSDWDAHTVELWLWHGTEYVADTVTHGFDVSFASLDTNLYGAGLYFACDPRLARWFQWSTRDTPGKYSQLILSRVICGYVAVRPRIQLHHKNCAGTRLWCRDWRCIDVRRSELRMPYNRRAPSGYHSCTSEHRIELIVYKDHHAVPMYVFDYTSIAASDPYGSLFHELERLQFFFKSRFAPLLSRL